MDFIHLLSETEVDYLRSILGCKTLSLYTTTVDVSTLSVLAPHFSIEIGSHDFCVVESDWRDTPEEAIDYHMMHVSISDFPKYVPKVKIVGTETYALGQPVSHVELTNSSSQVVRIEVLEFQQQGRKESVHYDHSILCTFADATQFVFSPPQTMVPLVGGLESTGKTLMIERFTEGLTVRRTLE